MNEALSARLRSERGMGLIELLIAMTVLQIAIFAIFAMMQAGALAILRASRVSAATAMGEQQLELYRGLLYRDIGLVDRRHRGGSKRRDAHRYRWALHGRQRRRRD